MYFEKFSLKISSQGRLQSVLIFSILNHPRFFWGYYFHIGVFLSYKTNIFVVSLTLKVILHVADNDSKYRDVAPYELDSQVIVK